MKKLALILLCGVASMALSAEEYTIQTISALKESSITPAFEKKIQKSALHSVKSKEGNCNIVTVGQYSTAKKASVDLKKVKKIAKDAFVRPLNRVTPKVCEVQIAEHKSEKVAKENSTVVKVQEAQAVAEKPKEVMVSAQSTPETASVQKVQLPIDSIQATVIICDRNAVRKNDISEALEYYKNSPYYTFRPIALQQR